jgi:hypothetical protein
MKAGRIALSFGYIVTADFKRDDGVRELLGIDLFEVSLTPSPANPETRIVSMKAATAPVERPDPVMAIFDEANEQWRKDRDLERLIAKAQATAARDERRERPVQVRHFTV